VRTSRRWATDQYCTKREFDLPRITISVSAYLIEQDPCQYQSARLPTATSGRRNLITPNPKLQLIDQVRELMQLKHSAIRTETAYCGWIRRYVKFHKMRSVSTL